MDKYEKEGEELLLKFSDFCDLITPKDPPSYVAKIIKQKF
jgi:hypothetical protein